MIQCQRYDHTQQIQFICIHKECDRRVFCKNCKNLNGSCKIYTKNELLILLEKNFKYCTQDINEYNQALLTLVSSRRNQQFKEIITNVSNEIKYLQGQIKLSNYLIQKTKNQYYDVDQLDLYFQNNNISGPINKIKQFCNSFSYLSLLELRYYQYEINTQFKCKENKKVQIYKYKDQVIKPQQHQNLILQEVLKKDSCHNFNPSICKISPDEKIIMILQIFKKFVKVVAWKAKDPKKKIMKCELSQKFQQFQFTNNSKFIYVWDTKGCLQLFNLFKMKKIYYQKFNKKLITCVRQGQQNRLIICFDKRHIQIYTHQRYLCKVVEMKFCDYSYPLDLLLTKNKDTNSIHINSLKSLSQTIINSKLSSLKSYCFINDQKQIGFYDKNEMKLKIYDISLPQIILNIIYAVEFDYYIDKILFKFEKQFIYLITDQEFLIIDVQNMIVETSQNQITKGENFKQIIVGSKRSVITYDGQQGIKIQSSQ